MGWTKTMSKQEDCTEQTVCDHFAGMEVELNFRLLCETKDCGQMLWVESITVTGFETAEDRVKKEGKAKKDSRTGT